MMWKTISDSLRRFESDLRMQWNDELLSSEFALSDGTTVTWGEASIQHHEWRAEMHAKNAAAGIEGAARHRAAISLLRSSGMPSLNEAVKVAA